MGDLADFARKNSKWLKLDDGESIAVKYLGFAFMLNQNGDEVPCYKFKLLDGETKSLQSQSGFLANFFDSDKGEAKVGDTVKLTRTGLSTETRYQVVVDNTIVL